MKFRMPEGYTSRLDNLHFVDNPTPTIHQHQVYDLLGYLAKRAGCTRIIDIGCGSAEKLRSFDGLYALYCLDTSHVRDLIAHNAPSATFIECNLENGLEGIDLKIFENACVVCSDVIEHLRSPNLLLGDLGRIAEVASYMLISTPDRTRARGLLDFGPPGNPAHTMEWSADELGRFMIDCKFRYGFLIGYTLNNDHDLAKNTILAIAGREATYAPPAVPKTVAAIINVYNEADIIEVVLRHLADEGVRSYVVDNWSDDGSYEIVQALHSQGLCARVVRYPEAAPQQGQWHELLEHSASFASTLTEDWIIHYDADELRRSPWQGVRLVDAISFVDALGYSAIDFTVINFGFTGSENEGGFVPADYVHFEFGRHPAHLVQVKGWKNLGQKVTLSRSGGHVAEFDGARVFPIKFMNLHYPLRSATQARTKIFRGRHERLAKEIEEKGWHTHYDAFRGAVSIEPWKAYELRSYDQFVFQSEYLVERISGIGIETDERIVPNIGTKRMIDSARDLSYDNMLHELKTLRNQIAKLELLQQENQKLSDQANTGLLGQFTHKLRSLRSK